MSTENGNNLLEQVQSLPLDNGQPIANNIISKQGLQQNVGQVQVDNVNFSEHPIETDPWIYRIVVGGLTSTVLICLIGAIGLQAKGAERIPELLTALGTGSLGALSGLLAPSPVKR
jgi:hypothetical protein